MNMLRHIEIQSDANWVSAWVSSSRREWATCQGLHPEVVSENRIRVRQRMERLGRPNLRYLIVSNCLNDSSAPTDDYISRLSAYEASGDWLAALEALTEVRVLKVELGAEGYGSAIRLLSNHGQWERAAGLFRDILAKGLPASEETLRALFLGLSRERQGRVALELLQAVQGSDGWSAYSPETHGAVQNSIIRALARESLLEEAHSLQLLIQKAGMPIQKDTYTALAVAYVAAGDEVMAEQMLEERDYL
eukprot:jgi/Botrbrau1/11098/Bobra.0219s0008.2